MRFALCGVHCAAQRGAGAVQGGNSSGAAGAHRGSGGLQLFRVGAAGGLPLPQRRLPPRKLRYQFRTPASASAKRSAPVRLQFAHRAAGRSRARSRAQTGARQKRAAGQERLRHVIRPQQRVRQRAGDRLLAGHHRQVGPEAAARGAAAARTPPPPSARGLRQAGRGRQRGGGRGWGDGAGGASRAWRKPGGAPRGGPTAGPASPTAAR